MNSSKSICESVDSLDDNMDSLSGNVASRLILAPRLGIAGFSRTFTIGLSGQTFLHYFYARL